MYKAQKNRQSYSISFVIAVFLHITIIAFLFIKFSSSIAPSAESAPDFIQAKTVDQNEINTMMAKIDADKQQHENLIKQQQLEAQQKLIAQQKIEQAKQIEAQKQQEIAKAAKESLEQYLVKKQKEEATALEANKTLEQKKILAEANKQNQKLIEQAFAKQLAAENKQLKEASVKTKTATTAANKELQNEIDKYKTLILQAISQEWIIPKDIENGMTCKLLVALSPDGSVLKIDILQKSGNDLLDNSAKTAVLKASPLPVPKDISVFNNFRNLRLTVKPEGIVNE